METGYIKFTNVETDKPIIEVKIVDGTVWMAVNEIFVRGIFPDNQ